MVALPSAPRGRASTASASLIVFVSERLPRVPRPSRSCASSRKWHLTGRRSSCARWTCRIKLPPGRRRRAALRPRRHDPLELPAQPRGLRRDPCGEVDVVIQVSSHDSPPHPWLSSHDTPLAAGRPAVIKLATRAPPLPGRTEGVEEGSCRPIRCSVSGRTGSTDDTTSNASALCCHDGNPRGMRLRLRLGGSNGLLLVERRLEHGPHMDDGRLRRRRHERRLRQQHPHRLRWLHGDGHRLPHARADAQRVGELR